MGTCRWEGPNEERKKEGKMHRMANGSGYDVDQLWADFFRRERRSPMAAPSEKKSDTAAPPLYDPASAPPIMLTRAALEAAAVVRRQELLERSAPWSANIARKFIQKAVDAKICGRTSCAIEFDARQLWIDLRIAPPAFDAELAAALLREALRHYEFPMTVDLHRNNKDLFIVRGDWSEAPVAASGVQSPASLKP